jgi:hypothetical protein
MGEKVSTYEIGGQQFTGRRMGGAMRELYKAAGTTKAKVSAADRNLERAAKVAVRAGKRGKK